MRPYLPKLLTNIPVSHCALVGIVDFLGQAQSDLGNAFNAGRGVPQNLLIAYAWLSIAAARGDSVAITNRDIVAKKLTNRKRAANPC